MKSVDWGKPAYGVYAVRSESRHYLTQRVPCALCGKNIPVGATWARGPRGEQAVHKECREALLAERAAAAAAAPPVEIAPGAAIYRQPMPTMLYVRALTPAPKCNRGACRAALIRAPRRESIWFNHGNAELYCHVCARKINEFTPGLCEQVIDPQDTPAP